MNRHWVVYGKLGGVSECFGRQQKRWRKATRAYIGGLVVATSVMRTLPTSHTVPATAIVRLCSDRSSRGFDAGEMAAPMTVITIDIIDTWRSTPASTIGLNFSLN